jgi:hypothetical protein
MKCILCGGELKHYDGILGYESMQCEKCHWDINSLIDNGKKIYDFLNGLHKLCDHYLSHNTEITLDLEDAEAIAELINDLKGGVE